MSAPEIPNDTPHTPKEAPQINDASINVDATSITAALRILLVDKNMEPARDKYKKIPPELQQAVDNELMEDVASFLKSYTGAESLWEITKRSSLVSLVTSGYQVRKQKVPPNIEEISLKLSEVADNKIMEDASAFLKSFTGLEPVAEISAHASYVSAVIDGYQMQGQDTLPEIDAMHFQLTVLLCWHHIDSVSEELEQAPLNVGKIQKLMALALDCAQVLSRGYKYEPLLREVKSLQNWMNHL